jgi:hypothetical protein
MKKLLLGFCLLFSTLINAQTDTTGVIKNAIQVKPIVLNVLNKDTLYQFTVSVFGLQLKDTAAGANTYISFYDRKAKKIGEKNVPLPSEVVNNWGTDDGSVINYILNILGLSKK